MLITPRRFAELLGVSGRTTERWRRQGYGPPAIRVGDGPNARYRYDFDTVLWWIRERTGAAAAGASVRDPDQLLDDAALAEITGWSIATIRTRRCRGLPMPEVTRIGGRSIRYRRAAVEAFIARHADSSTDARTSNRTAPTQSRPSPASTPPLGSAVGAQSGEKRGRRS
jgi:phage terminase Nu1 subunit (DNA packaging protein)